MCPLLFQAPGSVPVPMDESSDQEDRNDEGDLKVEEGLDKDERTDESEQDSDGA